MKKHSKVLHVRWVRSAIGFDRRQKQMVRSLGLRRLNQTVEVPDTPAVRGLVSRIPHLVKVVSSARKPTWTATPEYTVRAVEVEKGEAAENRAPADDTEA